MSRAPIAIVLLILCCSVTVNGHAQQREEFNGPYKSWANVKTRFGAIGNGSNDDTRALQEAIDNVGNQPAPVNNMGKDVYSVIYLPAGTYCISSTLAMRGKIGVSIIGEDPARTIIKWTGTDKDTVLWTNGSSYFKVARLTFDANGRKEMEGIGIHWKNKWNDGKTHSYAPLNIDISDDYFIGGFGVGLGGGTFAGPEGTGATDSEVSIRRCIFRDCTVAGIYITGFNALDYWIWDSQFWRCRIGVQCSYGGYHINRSLFSGSATSDTYNKNGYYNSIRGSYSDHSTAFSIDEGSSSNPFKRVFQDNTVVSPKAIAIEYYHTGKLTILGNRFSRPADTALQLSVNVKSWSGYMSEVLSLHNTYGGKTPLRIGSTPNTIYSYKDQIATSFTPDIEAFKRTMDQKPPQIKRKVFEVPSGSNGQVIQSIINQAAGLKGQRPVVHFPAGNYLIGKTLEIPAGSDMQLAGDGLLYASVIRADTPASFRSSPLLLIKGPSYISIRDLQFGSEADKGQFAGIVFEKLDQPGSQAQLDQIYSSHSDTSLLVIGMNYLYVQKENSFFTDGNYIVGGDLMGNRNATARVACFGGQFARLTVLKNARFLAKDCWWEGGVRAPLALQGSGAVTIDGAMIAPAQADSLPSIKIDRFDGRVSLMNMYLQGSVDCRPDNPNLHLLLWNILFYHKMAPLAFMGKETSYQAAGLGLNAQCFRPNDPACKSIISVDDKWQNVPDINSFLDDQTAQDREEKPLHYTNLAPGISNIYLSRISFGAMKRGIEFR